MTRWRRQIGRKATEKYHGVRAEIFPEVTIHHNLRELNSNSALFEAPNLKRDYYHVGDSMT